MTSLRQSAKPTTPNAMLAELRTWSRRQWQVAAWVSGGAFLAMGIAGETLPGASLGRTVPVEWWNYATLVVSPVLIGLIAATFVADRQPKSSWLGSMRACRLA